ncbi:MAG: hypothetical protein J6K04_02100 [Lachnospiraceae bacterium]|nr:hypothetical protein [Lachnospiraceae bacterium]
MYQYTVSQWLFFFFWYCFIGWIWECCYVSVTKAWEEKKWRWINRGFLHGPVIPIYGFAAISILLATIPYKESILFVFLLGALAASLMELVTGSVMEKIFHVKYWDYSDLPLNYKGHVCFFVSIFWGFLSVLMVRVIHVPIEKIILQVPALVTEIAALLMIAVFTYDFKESLQEAMDLKELLEKLDDYKVVMQRLENRVDALIAFTPIPDIDEVRKLPENAKEKLLYKVEELREKHIGRLQEIRSRLDKLGETLEGGNEMVKQVEKQIRAVFSRTNQQYMRVRNHLKRNPGVISKRYEEVLKELKDLFD